MDTPKRVAARPAAQALARTVVFDLDGVLVDVSASYRMAILRTVAALGGGEATPAAVQALKNAGGFNNDWDLSRELLRQRGRQVDLPRVTEVFNQFYLGPGGDGAGGLIMEESWLLPAELLEGLRQRYRLAIFTGRPRLDAEFVLRRFAVREAFEDVVAMEDVDQQKPNPEGLLELRRRHAPGRLAAYLGDTVDDARCSVAAEVPFIAILPAGQLQQEELAALFRQAGCQNVVGDVAAAARQLLADD